MTAVTLHLRENTELHLRDAELERTASEVVALGDLVEPGRERPT